MRTRTTPEALQTSRDLTVRLAKDRPEDLVRLVQTLSRAGVNIEGLAAVDGVVHVLAKDPRAARLALREGGFAIDRELEVLMVSAPAGTDAVSRALERLSEAGVMAEFVYAASESRVVIGPDNMPSARKAFGLRG